MNLPGPEGFGKIALQLGTTWEKDWSAIRCAGGSAAFEGKTSTEQAALLAMGRQKRKDSATVPLAAVAVLRDTALEAEAAAFSTILAATGDMSDREVRHWILDPPVYTPEAKSAALSAEIKLKAIRARCLLEDP